MSDITATPFGAAEHCRLDNWAAEYAKKLFVAEAAKRTEEIAQEAEARDAAITQEASDREAAIEEAKADVLSTYASTSQAGVIRLHKLNSYNNSGIIVENDGSAYVYTGEQYGTQRSGDGRIQIAAATAEEINAGKQQFKPIVPATLKAAVEKHTGAAESLPVINGSKPANLVAAAIALNESDEEIREAVSDLVVTRGITAAQMQAALDELEDELETQISGQAAHHTTDVAGIWGTLGTSKDVEPLTPIKTGEISPRGTYYETQPSSVTHALTLLSNALDYERNVRIAAVEGKVSSADMQAALTELEDELETQISGQAAHHTTDVAGIWGTLGTSKDVEPLTPIKTGEISPRGTYYETQPSSVTHALTLLSNALDYERNVRIAAVEGKVSSADMQAALTELEDELETQISGQAAHHTTDVAGIWGTLGTSKDVAPLTPIKTGQISSRGSYYVTQPENVTHALTLLSNALDFERDARMNYSTSPKRIGTWTDNVTPVWRAVIPSTAVAGGILRLRDILSSLVSDPDDAVLIDHKIYFRNVPSSYVPSETPSSGTVTYDEGTESWTINNTGATDPAASYYGRIEFASAESNVNT